MTNEIIPVLIDEDNPKGRTILRKVAEAIANATRSDLSILTKLQKENIREACERLSVGEDGCKFSPGYLFYQERNLFGIFYLGHIYCSRTDYDFDGNDRSSYSIRWSDAVACLTPTSKVFGVIDSECFLDEDNRLLPRKAIKRMERASDFCKKLQEVARKQESERIYNVLIDLSKQIYDEFTPLSSYANFVYRGVEQELEKLQEQLRQEEARRREGIKRAKNLIARL